MENLIRKRGWVKTRLTRSLARIEDIKTGTLTQFEVEIREKKLNEVWSDFRAIQEEMLVNLDDENTDPLMAEQEEFEEKYYRAIVSLNALQKTTESSPSPVVAEGDTSVKAAGTVKLPTLELPTFMGDFKTWISFSDMFKALIDENHLLSGAQKLHYLKSCLKGEAVQLLRSVQVTDSNYDGAWNILRTRYENKRLIMQAHLKTLFDQPIVKSESPVALRNLLDCTTENIRALDVLGQKTEHWDAFIVHLVAEKMDPDTRKQWELSITSDTIPSFSDLTTFLESRCRSLSAATSVMSRITSHKLDRPPFTRTLHSVPSKCPICHSTSHSIYKCEQFKELLVSDRIEKTKHMNLCFNCLRPGHGSNICNSSSCRICGKKHHSLLHIETNRTTVSPVAENPSVNAHVMNRALQSRMVLLSTALVVLENHTGSQETCRALLDSGSEASFITEDCVRRLKLQRKRVVVPVTGLGSTGSCTAYGQVSIKLRPQNAPNVIYLDALILPKVTGNIPSVPIDIKEWDHLTNLRLADPKYFYPAEVDLLLGAEVCADVMSDGRIVGPRGTPIAQNTLFGWVLSGRVRDESQVQVSIRTHFSTNDVGTLLRKFWEIENIPEAPTFQSLEEKQCEKHFKETHSRDGTGRYIVKLPFKSDHINIGESRRVAVNRLHHIERRLERNPTEKRLYHDFMLEYLKLGHMELIPEDEIIKESKSIYYLPHHAVCKETSSTTKLRVVFDASAKSSTGVSLNDILMVGPKLQDDIVDVLMRFRTYKVGLTADVSKMYRQVLMSNEDLDFQRILWREPDRAMIKEYRLRTVTYGTASAPYLAIKCLQQLARDEALHFPIASQVVLSNFYVDDMMTGSENIESAVLLQTELLGIMTKGGFELRKWASNAPELLETLPPQLRVGDDSLSISGDGGVRTLGLLWHPATDCFSFSVNLLGQTTSVTKRELLSSISRIFDPLGWLAPATLVAKRTFQKLWLLGLSWDDCVPMDIFQQWMSYKEEAAQLSSLRIPRFILPSTQKSIEVHGFCDASEIAYAAVVYLRYEMEPGIFNVSLVCAKTKLSPLKQISLPRLELCGALLLARLIRRVCQVLNYEVSCVYGWTDSTVVLSWIRGHPKEWKTFVANRVSEIQELIPPERWGHVKSENNAADVASRGISPSGLCNHHTWWSGPSWLSKEILQHSFFRDEIPEVSMAALEFRSPTTALHIEITDGNDILNKYSSLNSLKRITALCFRFIRNLRLPIQERYRGFLKTTEMAYALRFWIRRVQQEQFLEEINACKSGDDLPRKSKLLCLHPFIDTTGLIRVGGRLQEAHILEDRKHPIILPHRHFLTELIIRHEHLSHMHAGLQLLLTVLGRHYWIISGRRIVRQVIHKCIICARYRASTSQQLMGNLPAVRVEPMRPFLRSGVDYAGPFTIRTSAGRGTKKRKCYLALFVCLVTKALHLELVSDLTTNAFIGALKRFISRRGRCIEILSDCGTNFVGAKAELPELLNLAKSSAHNASVAKFLSNEGIKWQLNPPGAPHFGGIWEAGVKSVKYHLRRIVGDVSLTFEELYTIFTQIEACLNSRPLCPSSPDPDDLSALTPGHFIMGEAMTAIPEPDLTPSKMNRLTRWQLVQQLTQHFWKRWSSEYLSRLQQRPKWCTSSGDMAVGDMVLIKENLPPCKWKLGRVIETHAGKDGAVRVVTLRTQSGNLKRPIVKLCKLPLT